MWGRERQGGEESDGGGGGEKREERGEGCWEKYREEFWDIDSHVNKWRWNPSFVMQDYVQASSPDSGTRAYFTSTNENNICTPRQPDNMKNILIRAVLHNMYYVTSNQMNHNSETIKV